MYSFHPKGESNDFSYVGASLVQTFGEHVFVCCSDILRARKHLLNHHADGKALYDALGVEPSVSNNMASDLQIDWHAELEVFTINEEAVSESMAIDLVMEVLKYIWHFFTFTKTRWLCGLYALFH